MKIAITGSEGFLGKIISKKLDSEGHTIVECNRKNCDILNPKQVLKALKGSQAVVHCAAQLEETSKDIYEVNVRGTENVLEEMVRFVCPVDVANAAPLNQETDLPCSSR